MSLFTISTNESTATTFDQLTQEIDEKRPELVNGKRNVIYQDNASFHVFLQTQHKLASNFNSYQKLDPFFIIDLEVWVS